MLGYLTTSTRLKFDRTNVESTSNGSSGDDRKEGEEVDFMMLTYASERGAEEYEKLTPEEVAANIELHNQWFAAHRDSITGGHHLAWPRRWGRISDHNQLVVHDGPFGESKEALGGVILLSADTLEDAFEIARTWPSLDSNFGAVVEVIPLGGFE